MLLAIVGATGTGKSELALDVAGQLRAAGQPAEIINTDAMQLYRGMDIGTAKLSLEERRGIPHHLLDVLTVRDEASVAWFQVEARAKIAEIESRGAVPILVGGSTLYASSVLFDLRFPARNDEVRARLEAELAEVGSRVMHERLRAADAEAASAIDPANGRRVVRALEVIESGAGRVSGELSNNKRLVHPAVIAHVREDRETLVQRLDVRVVAMWQRGILDEVRALRDEWGQFGTTAARAIGYAQAAGQIDGALTEQEAIAETQALTRKYARRQVSWFRRYRQAIDVSAGDPTAARRLAESLQRTRPGA